MSLPRKQVSETKSIKASVKAKTLFSITGILISTSIHFSGATFKRGIIQVEFISLTASNLRSLDFPNIFKKYNS